MRVADAGDEVETRLEAFEHRRRFRVARQRDGELDIEVADHRCGLEERSLTVVEAGHHLRFEELAEERRRNGARRAPPMPPEDDQRSGPAAASRYQRLLGIIRNADLRQQVARLFVGEGQLKVLDELKPLLLEGSRQRR